MSIKALSDYTSDILDEKFIKKYQDKNPEWGFNGLGYLVYKRTYARKISENQTEEWWQTVARCVNGAQKIGADYSKKEAEVLYDKVFNLKCNFAGRMLWQLGTSTVDRFGANSLLNCWFTKINNIQSFLFLFENLMLGGGVGFSVKREDIHELPKVKSGVLIEHKLTKDADFIIPDSREGWIKTLEYVLRSFFHTGKSFSYSSILIRPAGDTIHGFGGTASGPKILIEGIEQICSILKGREGKKIRSVDALDICNIIGSIVVAGNVRRCLPKGSKILLKDGVKNIEDIETGDMVLTSSGYEKVSNTFIQGKQNLLKITTKDGLYRCTANHRVAVLSSIDKYKWVEAKNLTPGDRLVSNTTPIAGSKTSLPEYSYIRPCGSTTCKDITIPELDSGMAWFLGMVHGDGYVYYRKKRGDNDGSNTVSVACNSKDKIIIDRVLSEMSRFGIPSRIKERKNENCVNVVVYSTQLAQYFSQNFKQPKQRIKIPKCIWNAENHIKMGYLHGIFDSDGAASNRPVVLCTTVYKGFAYEIQALAYSCGMSTRIYESSLGWESKKGFQQQVNVHLISNKDKEYFNTFCECKTARVSKYSKRSGSYPSQWIKDDARFNKVKTKIGVYASERINVDRVQKFGCDVSLYPTEVVSISASEPDQTFDIEVENKNEFYCEGILTHNSAQIALGDPDDYLFLRAKRWDLGHLPAYRSMSNNTIYCNSFEHTSDALWQGFNGNGEAYGLFNLGLSRSYGRISDGPMKKSDFYPQNKDGCNGTNPCGEISLDNYECCNLSDLYLNNIDSKEEMLECARLLFKTQKAICRMGFLHKETEAIVHKNLRIGVGITGICQSPEKHGWLDFVYRGLRKFDKSLSKKLGCNESIKITTVKPSGTLSLLAGSTPGVHPAFSRFYTRRIRMSSTDRLVPLCREAGYNTEYQENIDGSINRDTTIVEFPCDAGADAILAKDMSAIDQLELVKKIQADWADNAVSVTVYYKKEELDDIKDWLRDNYEHSIKSISFLLHSGHGFKQAPYEESSEEVYIKMLDKVKPICIEDASGASLDVECDGGACPIK